VYLVFKFRDLYWPQVVLRCTHSSVVSVQYILTFTFHAMLSSRIAVAVHQQGTSSCTLALTSSFKLPRKFCCSIQQSSFSSTQLMSSQQTQEHLMPEAPSGQDSRDKVTGQLRNPQAISVSTKLPNTNPSHTIRTLLPLLTAQRPHYATIHIHARPYLLTEGDTVRLPFRMQGVQPGDIIRLTRLSTIGSRDYTLRGSPYIDEDIYECRGVVAGIESEPMRFKEKTVRRNRRVKTIKSKHRFTELTIRELKIKQSSP
jgi:large subunit ribosomal protein L21